MTLLDKTLNEMLPVMDKSLGKAVLITAILFFGFLWTFEGILIVFEKLANYRNKPKSKPAGNYDSRL